MSWFKRHRSEQGAIAVMMALVICLVLIPLAAFTVDLGTQRIARKDMQAVADTVALDMARELSANGAIENTVLTSDAKASAKQAQGVVGLTLDGDGNPHVTARKGYIDPAKFKADQSLGCGTPTDEGIDNGYFTTTVPDGQKANAVLVTVSGSVNFMIHGGSGSVCRSAIGTAKTNACMTINSYAAALHSGDSSVLGPLNKILGTSIDLEAINSSGILDTDLDVLRFLNILKTNLNVGSLDEVLAANVSAAQIIDAEAQALQQQGLAGYDVAAAFLQNAIAAHFPSPAPIKVGDLLGVTQGGSAALETTLNPLDLAAAAVQLANGSNPLHITASSDNLTGLGLDVILGGAPKHACLGDGTQTVQQTKVTATANFAASGTVTGAIVSLVNGLTNLLGNTLCLVGGLLGGNCYGAPQITALGPLTATVNLAQASGSVTGVDCTHAPSSLSVLEKSSLAPAEVTVPITITMKHTFYKLLGAIDHVDTLTSTLYVTISTDPATDESKADTLYYPDDKDGKAGPSADLSVGNLQLHTEVDPNSNIELINKLGGHDGLINNVQNLLISPLLTTLVSPLLSNLANALKNMIGLTIAGSTFAPDPIDCSSPLLKG